MVILTTILTLFRDYKPLTFFGSLGLVPLLAALVRGSGSWRNTLRKVRC
jgi:hypothetical protein